MWIYEEIIQFLKDCQLIYFSMHVKLIFSYIHTYIYIYLSVSNNKEAENWFDGATFS